MVAQGGFGVVIKIDTGTLTAVVQALEVEFPEFEKILAEVTGHDATGGWAEWVATGKRVLNEFTIKVAWDTSEATHAQFVTEFNLDVSVDMSVEDPDSDETIAFAAHIVKIGRVSEQEEGYVSDITIQPTGQPTIT